MKKTIKMLVAVLGLAIISSSLNGVSAGGCVRTQARIAQPVSLDRGVPVTLDRCP